MESRTRASERITEQVTSWRGVTAGPGRRGEFAFRVGRREIGHLHGDQAAHFGFPKEIWGALFEQGGKPAVWLVDGDTVSLKPVEIERLNRFAGKNQMRVMDRVEGAAIDRDLLQSPNA